jgi:hypothetical protein
MLGIQQSVREIQSLLISRQYYHGPNRNEAINKTQICDLTKRTKLEKRKKQ